MSRARRSWVRSGAALALLVGLTGCGEEQTKTRGMGRGKPAAPAPAAAPAKPAAPAAAGAAGAGAPAENPRRKPLKDDDFYESETNRDPFRSFLSELSRPVGGPRTAGDVKVYFKNYGCEELGLIAIIAGGLNPHAMFKDPRGIGIAVRVGDRMCRSQAKVIRIVQEAVILETEEDLGGAKTRPVQKRIPIRNDEVMDLTPASQ